MKEKFNINVDFEKEVTSEQLHDFLDEFFMEESKVGKQKEFRCRMDDVDGVMEAYGKMVKKLKDVPEKNMLPKRDYVTVELKNDAIKEGRALTYIKHAQPVPDDDVVDVSLWPLPCMNKIDFKHKEEVYIL
jgi:hypothetical protein